MHDPEYDVHPLDRDYSTPSTQPAPRTRTATEILRGIGVIVFGIGFAIVFLCAIALGAFTATGWVESLGSAMHRIAMVAILVGGIMIVISYRLPAIKQHMLLAGEKPRRHSLETLVILLAWNVVMCGFFFKLFGALSSNRSLVSPDQAFKVLIMVTIALMIMAMAWYRGPLRAYAIGILVAILINFILSMFPSNLRLSRRAHSFLLFGQLATMQLIGLLCAGYVGLFVSDSKFDDASRNSLPDLD